MTKKPKPRRQRAHSALPAGFQWRGGRPRWIPSPARRKAGWRGVDLKAPLGAWLPLGEAIARAEAIADAVAGWARGEPVPPSFAEFAPADAAKGARPAIASAGARSIGVLIEGFLADPMPRRRPLAAKTRADYKSKLNRLVGAMAQHQRVDLAAFKRLDVAVLSPRAPGAGGDNLLDEGYRLLHLQVGEHMAHGAMAAASAWLDWVQRRKNLLPFNPAKAIARDTPAGRIVLFSWAELVAMVRMAEALGLASIADAIILAVDLAWSEQDLLALNGAQISKDGHVRHRRIKTGVAGNPELLPIGKGRLAQIEARWQAGTVRPTHVIVREGTTGPWPASAFQKAFARVRAAVALWGHLAGRDDLAAIGAKQFRDLRDTAITIAHNAALTIEEICTRSLHEPARAREVISEHYGALGQDLADGAAEKLGLHFAAKGYTFDQVAGD